MDMHEDIGKILLTEEQIKARVRELGAHLKQDYAGKELVVIALLKGAAYFATDLTLAMDMPVKIDFMVASSYGNSTNSCGNVSVKLDVAEELAGRHVILVDDIIDTGPARQHKPFIAAAFMHQADHLLRLLKGKQTCSSKLFPHHPDDTRTQRGRQRKQPGCITAAGMIVLQHILQKLLFCQLIQTISILSNQRRSLC